MNKKYIGWLLSIPAFLGIGLTSCSNEEPIAIKDVTPENLVEVTLTATISHPTRATLTPDKNIVKFAWSMGDIISVVNSDGKYIGQLTVSEVLEDVRKCKFTGNIAGSTDPVDLRFYYLGADTDNPKGKKPAINTDLSVDDLIVNFSTQTGVQTFASNDILIATGHYDKVQSNEQGKLNLGSLDFDREFAYGRFVLKVDGSEVQLAGKTVNISSGAEDGVLKNKTTLSLAKAEYTHEGNGISINITEGNTDDNSFYVSFLPCTPKQLKFTVDLGEQGVFEGTKGTSFTIAKSTYYTENDNGDAIVVEMTKVAGAEKTWNVKFYKDATDESPYDELTTDPLTDPYEWTVETPEVNPTKDGYEFKGWTVNGEDLGETLQLDPANEEVKIVAKWAEVYDYKLILKEDGKVEEIKKPSSEPSQQITPPQKDDEEFMGWKEEGTDDSTATKDPWELTPTKTEVTLVPVYFKYVVIWKDGYSEAGEDVIKTATVTKKDGYDISGLDPKDPTREGFEFKGWDRQISKLTKDLINGDDNKVIITATWEKLPNVIINNGYGPGTLNN